MSGRFPQSRDLREYWRNLCEGRECISFFGVTDVEDAAEPSGARFVPAGGFLDGIDRFDARFFGLSARDAEAMDPQQRVFLECAWHSLEDAGYDPDRYPGVIGVFAGAALSSYMADIYSNPSALASMDEYGLVIGNDKDHLTTQVAYRLNLRGPGVTVQTACSTSLVAVCIGGSEPPRPPLRHGVGGWSRRRPVGRSGLLRQSDHSARAASIRPLNAGVDA